MLSHHRNNALLRGRFQSLLPLLRRFEIRVSHLPDHRVLLLKLPVPIVQRVHFHRK